MSICRNNFLPLIQKRNRKKYQQIKKIQNNNVSNNQEIKNLTEENNKCKSNLAKSLILKHDRNQSGIIFSNNYIEKTNQNKLSSIQSDIRINFKIRPQNDIISHYISKIKKIQEKKAQICDRVFIVSPLKLFHKLPKSKLKTQSFSNPQQFLNQKNLLSCSLSTHQKTLQSSNFTNQNLSLNLLKEIKTHRYCKSIHKSSRGLKRYSPDKFQKSILEEKQIGFAQKQVHKTTDNDKKMFNDLDSLIGYELKPWAVEEGVSKGLDN